MNSKDEADIDLDFADHKQARSSLRHIKARQKDGRVHPNGLYFQDIPTDPIDGMAVWDDDTAASKGYFKVDFLTNTAYRGVRDETHLVELMTRPPPWHKFTECATVEKLAHIHNHFDKIQTIKPQSIEDLAVCLALIRPAKSYLIGKPRAVIDREIWLKPQDSDKYHFKRAHAIGYAASIVVQLNLLIEQNNV